MTLTQTAFLVKRLIIVSIATIVLGTASFIGYKIWYAYYLAHLPPVEEVPDIKFGTLPLIDFPGTQVSSSNFSYSLDTTTGGLPKIGIDEGFEKISRVYFITQVFATFLSPDRSLSLAEKFGIKTPATILSETKHKFSEGNKNLLVDLDNGNFSYTNQPLLPDKSSIPEDEKAVAGFKQVLANLGVSKSDLENGRLKVALLRIGENGFLETQLRQDANAIQISLWPQPLEKKSIYTADFNKSIISAVLTGEASNVENYFSIEFTYYPVDTTTFATYPTKEATAAFDDLKNGKGIIVLEPDKPQVSISSVYLGYYMPENYTPYLQPIYIFEGPGFAAYVSAIKEDFQSSDQTKLE